MPENVDALVLQDDTARLERPRKSLGRGGGGGIICCSKALVDSAQFQIPTD